MMIVMGHGIDFDRFLSHSSTHSTIGNVHGILVMMLMIEGMPKK